MILFIQLKNKAIIYNMIIIIAYFFFNDIIIINYNNKNKNLIKKNKSFFFNYLIKLVNLYKKIWDRIDAQFSKIFNIKN